MNEEKLTREQALGGTAKEAAENLTLDSLWAFASQQVARVPSSPEESSVKDSNSETELWRRGAHPSQAPPWNQRGKT
jgi:hypothetical protein